jgi:hypothetical protein
MTPEMLKAYLETLRGAGVLAADLTLGDGVALRVTFPQPEVKLPELPDLGAWADYEGAK